MKVAGSLFGSLSGIPAAARALEASGHALGLSAETSHDPLLPLALAAEHTEKLELMTSITVAFARSPMTLAETAHDINVLSKGRLILGLGSQIRPHITRRFSMPWSKPASRMREYILALNAIWDCWYKGEKLDFRGEFYTHTLMTPMFTPVDTEYGAPRVALAAVGPRMTEVAGEVADGIIIHAFTTEKYVREVTLPALESGLAKAGRSREDFMIVGPLFVVTGNDEKEFEQARRTVCKQIAFYGSTPAYRPVLEIEGFGDLQSELNLLSKQGKWDEMGERITDEILEKFAVVGLPDEIGPRMGARFGDVVNVINAYTLTSSSGLRQKLLKDFSAL
ncbi:MAG: TIGR03617 family F420-dependent LLM class oxidoreductase [Myxococcales bacterium]|nr:TIGR03617 family F420-dependent LLM class oxidoreductase [Myxococcales bacterium]